MSTVLWANTLVSGEVQSDENDLYALYKHSKKLDKLTEQLGLLSFSSTHDFTDMQFNLADDELPDGMESTDELMAQSGVWVAASEAERMLEALIAHISSKKVKFGLLKDDAEQVLDELKDCLAVAKGASSEGGKFNFSVVM